VTASPAPAPTETWTCDLVVVGSGGPGLAAAVTAACGGLQVIVVERDRLVGGTSAISGGALWIPGTRQAKAGDFSDSPDKARTYLRHLLGNRYDSELVEAFLNKGPEALTFLEDHTELRYSVRALSPDYYPEADGATDNGRALEVGEFDGRKLGPWFARLRPPPPGLMLYGGLMLSRTDVHHFMNFRRSLPSLAHCAKLMLRFWRDRLSHARGTRLVIGNAMVAALLKGCLDHGVRVETEITVDDVLTDGPVVTGVRGQGGDGRGVEIQAKAVVLASGGISRRPGAQADRPGTGSDHLSMAAPGADGAMVQSALALGAREGADLISNFYWAPMSKARHADGREETFPHIVTDRARPGIIAITDKAQRFVNEANSYHRFVNAMRFEHGAGVERFFLIADHAAVRRHGLGLARPEPGDNRKLLASGYLMTTPTLEALARHLDVPAAALAATVARFNAQATLGVDLDFERGASSYNRAMGDPTAAHPNLAPLTKPPFYAVEIFTGDLGSARGLVTNGSAQVLGRDGGAIPGLYAVGSDMNSVTAGEYAGPGVTLGPGLTFGYVAARAVIETLDQAGLKPVD
jgi:succinate dehydrogenase/fumarate reductase flavoprotein subunit